MIASPRDTVIEVEDVTLAYGDVIVQEHLSFAVHAREVFAILGPSGSGKSTLLRTMIGLYLPRHGRILLEGDPRTLPAEHGKDTLEELFITVAREPLSLQQT